MSQETSNIEQVIDNKPEVVRYEYAHLTMLCGKCNSKYIIESDVKGGIQVNLPTTSTAQITLVCKECGNSMGMFYVESSKKDEVVTEENITNEEPTTNGI